jgi:hypothetical protein
MTGCRGRESLPLQRRDESCPALITFAPRHSSIYSQIYIDSSGLLPAVEKTQAARTKPLKIIGNGITFPRLKDRRCLRIYSWEWSLCGNPSRPSFFSASQLGSICSSRHTRNATLSCATEQTPGTASGGTTGSCKRTLYGIPALCLLLPSGLGGNRRSACHLTLILQDSA